MNQKTRKLTESAILIALGTVLALLTNYIPFLNLPYGGSITIFSMVPLVVISYRYGVKWGDFFRHCFWASSDGDWHHRWRFSGGRSLCGHLFCTARLYRRLYGNRYSWYVPQ